MTKSFTIHKYEPTKEAEKLANEIRAVLQSSLEKARDLIREGCFQCFDEFEKIGKLDAPNAKLAVQMTTERICQYILENTTAPNLFTNS